MNGRRKLARLLLGLEALGVSIFTIYSIVRDFGSDISNHGLFTFLAVASLGISYVLWAAAIGIPRGVRWPQAPATMMQVAILLSCIAVFEAGHIFYGIPLVILAVATLVIVVEIRAEDAR